MKHVTRDGSRLLLAAMATGALLLLGGCGLFNPAEPEPPTQGGVHLPDLTSSSDSALFSLVSGLETKNSLLYAHALAESTVTSDAEFHAFFDPQDIARPRRRRSTGRAATRRPSSARSSRWSPCP